MKLVESISHTKVKNVMLKHGIEWRNSKSAFNITMEYTPIQFSGVSLGMSVVLVLIGSSIGPSIAAIYMQTHQEVITKEVSSISGGCFPSPISYNLIFLTAALVSTISIALVIILKRKMMITQPLIGSQKE